MKAQVRWMDDFTFVGQSASGHNIVMDGNKGQHAPSPMEMVLMGAGGCSSVDIIAGLKQAGQNVYDCIANLEAERREVAPKIFVKLHVHFVVKGKQLDEALVRELTTNSMEKYCSVCAMIGSGAEMTHSFEVVELA